MTLAEVIMLGHGKTKRRLHDRKTEHFKALTSNSHSSAIADLIFIVKLRKPCSFVILKPALNENIGSEKLLLY